MTLPQQRITVVSLGVAVLDRAEMAHNPYWLLAADGSLTLPEAP